MTDPYASPRATPPKVAGESSGHVVRAWARLAIPYNVALVLVTGGTGTLLAGPLFMRGRADALVVYALGANMCFLAGPVVELAYRFLGGRSLFLRHGLFVGGALFAAALAFGVALVMFQQPPMEAF